MNRLLRELAPVADEAWEAVDHEAQRALRHYLAARRLVDFDGPHGWQYAAVPLGRTEPVPGDGGPDGPGDPDGPDGLRVSRRLVAPLLEVRATFTLARAELDAAARGAHDVDLEPVVAAARALARTEDAAIFHGHEGAGIAGVTPASPHEVLPISDDYRDYPGTVARAVALLQESGVGGPYAVALGPRCHTGVIETTEYGGYPVLEHLRLIAGGPVVWAPSIDGAIVLSTRGGDFVLTVGQDVSLGYVDHDADVVRFRLEESFTFRAVTPSAAVRLAYP